ncbi:YajG family lipoprotein [Thalassotalea maritima]|uniref:YajG family lipoprotein n=1 Tax=Thalassotalea maritima TaxID=3242416 RepID=UPI0035295DE8
MKKNLLIAVVSAMCLFACAQEPSKINLNPIVKMDANKVYQQLNTKVSVYDLRKTAHVVEVLSANKPSVYINANGSLSSVLNSQFSEQLMSQGLTLGEGDDLLLQFQVERARTYVNQDVLDYRANTIIKLKVEAENAKQTLSKTYTLRATTRGALTADIDELQRDFNQQLGKIIVQVMQDQQLQQFIKG